MGKNKILSLLVLIFIFHAACGPGVEEQYKKAEEAFFHDHDDEKAFEIAYPLAKKGYAPAQSLVGNIYYDEEFSRHDVKLSFEWALKAARQGYAVAQRDVAYSYMLGCGVEKNEEEGFKWFQKAAEDDEMRIEVQDRIEQIKNGTINGTFLDRQGCH